MEATKERNEQMEKKEEDDPMAKAREIIREAIITDGENPNTSTTNKMKKKEGAQQLDDVLVFSRTVQKRDSSLE
uniref:Uncharacterized protein LOC104229818 n=1 Tax=Nicotiana sylvestris TaxID=4096 RepID=A0A1U7WU50_NICSY|nr:PREDICTED: uncharacterized protein LOC104229818 [Nicotiana sylvestris]